MNLYFLRFAKNGELPADLDHRVRDDELTAVEQRIHADESRVTTLQWTVTSAGPTLSSVTTPTFVAPRALRTWVGPVDPAASQRFTGTQTGLRPPAEVGYHAITSTKPRSIRWFAPPVVPGPAFPELTASGAGPLFLCSVCREDNRFYQFMYLTTPEPSHQAGHLGLGREQFTATCDDPTRPPSIPSYSCERHLYDDTGKELTPYVFPDLTISFSDGQLEVTR